MKGVEEVEEKGRWVVKTIGKGDKRRERIEKKMSGENNMGKGQRWRERQGMYMYVKRDREAKWNKKSGQGTCLKKKERGSKR